MSEREIFVDSKNMYCLLEDNNGNLLIEVVCGTIGLYEVKFKLNDKELESYKRLGKQSLDDLAYDVAKNTEIYLPRCEDEDD
ncbi:MAG: hypothetical protein AAGG80_00525 [Pseudomonadota bacterium]